MSETRVVPVDFTKMKVGQAATTNREIVKCPACGKCGEYRPSQATNAKIIHVGQIVAANYRTKFETLKHCKLSGSEESKLLDTMRARARNR